MPLDPDALLATLTLAQKVALLAGSDGWHTERVPGVPVLRCTDGPAGARGTSWNGPRSASFPCSTAPHPDVVASYLGDDDAARTRSGTAAADNEPTPTST